MQMAEEDRLTALPDDILNRILSYVPMDAAVRTSTLSNRWLHQWKFINVIHFSSLPELESYGFVDHCLSLIRSPKISRFVIVARVGLHVEPNFTNWVSFAVDKHVRSIEFYLRVGVKNEGWNWDGREEHFNLPDSFFLEDTESRQEIALSCVNFCPPTPKLGFEGYKFLKRLFLFDSKISDDGLELVMSTCEALESLSIIGCSGLLRPRISSATLKEFVYTKMNYRFCIGDISLEIDAPNLVTLNTFCSIEEIIGFNESCYPLEVRLHVPGEDFDFYYDNKLCSILRLMRQLTSVQFFGINNPRIQLLTKALYDNGGPANIFRALKEFYFSWGSVGVRRSEMVSILTMLGDCPSLNKVQLEFQELWAYPRGILPTLPTEREFMYENYFEDNKMDRAEEWGDEEKAGLSNANTLNQLQTIELYYYYGTKARSYERPNAVIDFVKCVLMKAVCLESLLLFYEPPKHHVLKPLGHIVTPVHLQQQLLTEVSLLPRAASCTEIRLG